MSLNPANPGLAATAHLKRYMACVRLSPGLLSCTSSPADAALLPPARSFSFPSLAALPRPPRSLWDLTTLRGLDEDTDWRDVREKALVTGFESKYACSSAYFDPTGTRLATTSYDDKIRCASLSPSLAARLCARPELQKLMSSRMDAVWDVEPKTAVEDLASVESFKPKQEILHNTQGAFSSSLSVSERAGEQHENLTLAARSSSSSRPLFLARSRPLRHCPPRTLVAGPDPPAAPLRRRHAPHRRPLLALGEQGRAPVRERLAHGRAGRHGGAPDEGG